VQSRDDFVVEATERCEPRRGDQVGRFVEETRERRQLESCIESEHDRVRLLVAPMGEPAPFVHDQETALRQHTDRRGVVARGLSVKRTGCLQLQELLQSTRGNAAAPIFTTYPIGDLAATL